MPESLPPLQSLHSTPVRDAASRFLREHADGSPLYPAGSFASPVALERRARKLDAWDGDRAALAAWLAEQNGSASLHPAQVRNLADAARPDAIFVLTGQQPGLLGGPALGLYKAMTAVAVARDCAARLGRPVIPIFWAAGDDSDLTESNAAEFLEPGASYTSAALEFPDAEAAIPMSLRNLAAPTLKDLQSKIPAWPADTRARLDASYVAGRSLTAAFLALMQDLIGSEGVLFVDGFAAAQRPESQALLRRIASGSAEFHEALLRGTTRLRETLNQPPQVPVRPGTVPVFALENGTRVRLFASDSGRVYSADDEATDLRPLLPRKTLLHSALTRPLVVDTLFPVLGHVLGPAELRYFAQITDVFAAFGRGYPLLTPRRQGMVVRAADLKTLRDTGIAPEELTDLRPSRVRAHLTAQAWSEHPAAEEFPDPDYRALRETLEAYQARRFPGARFDGALRRLDRAFGNYRESARAQVFAEAAAARFKALQPLLRWLAGGTQDRHLNLLSLHAALGEAGFAALLAQMREPADGATVYVVNDPHGDSE